MYASHFGLTEAPFSITPDPRFLYMSERHREGLAHLLFGIQQPGGFVQLTGEVGTGKTTLCRCLLEQLPPKVDVALVLNPRVTAVEFLATVCDELWIRYPRGTTSIKALVDALYRYLLETHGRGRRSVLIVDEAQNLSVDVLEQIRLLTNLETVAEKLLQIILIGQPELLCLLERRELRQLAQRITARYHLRRFVRPDTCGYIRHRIRVAGGSDALFSPAAMRRVHRLSGGIPRLINVICDRALLGAYAHDLHRVDAATVWRASREVRGKIPRSWRLRRLAWGFGLGMLGLALIGVAILVTPGQLSLPWRPAAPQSVSPDERPAAVVPGPGASLPPGAGP
jgi:general secretion pathway protein A